MGFVVEAADGEILAETLQVEDALALLRVLPRAAKVWLVDTEDDLVLVAVLRGLDGASCHQPRSVRKVRAA